MQPVPPTVTALNPERHGTSGLGTQAAPAPDTDFRTCPMAARQLYLQLMKKSLTFLLYGLEDEYVPIRRPRNPLKRLIFDSIKKRGVELLMPKAKDLGKRFEGKDWPMPKSALTAIGMIGLDNLQFCVEDVLRRGIAGDLIETGAWRGGASIFMRSVLKAHGVEDRKVYVADSFEGLPKPDPDKYPADAAEERKRAFYKFDQLAVSEEQARENFARYVCSTRRCAF